MSRRYAPAAPFITRGGPVLCCLMLAACTGLPKVERLPPADAGLTLTHAGRNRALMRQPGFDPAQYSGYRLGGVVVQTAPGLSARRAKAIERIRQDMTATLTRGEVAPAGSESALQMDVTLKDIDASNTMLNILSAAALYLPFDAGAMTVETRLTDTQGHLVSLRRDRLQGRVTEIGKGWSKYGRIAKAAHRWSERCRIWPACAVPKSPPQ